MKCHSHGWEKSLIHAAFFSFTSCSRNIDGYALVVLLRGKEGVSERYLAMRLCSGGLVSAAIRTDF
jgi:hypothetical protein